ncbi:MAG: hypothetical protein DRO00_08265 [Thermoproteota archaeon]|nr:MAG: hypothetical protein DRO00_08265 [Candidatus Korarchaeota archaeon]
MIDELFSPGIKLGLVLSSRRKVVELVIRETGLGGVFDFIIAQEDVERLKTQLLQDPLAAPSSGREFWYVRVESPY